jgi:hypothetical protein
MAVDSLVYKASDSMVYTAHHAVATLAMTVVDDHIPICH